MCYRDFLYEKIKRLQNQSMDIILENDELSNPELVEVVKKLDRLIVEWVKYRK